MMTSIHSDIIITYNNFFILQKQVSFTDIGIPVFSFDIKENGVVKIINSKTGNMTILKVAPTKANQPINILDHDQKINE